jgi:hypothetical protein
MFPALRNASTLTNRSEDLISRGNPNQKLVNNAKKEASNQSKTARSFSRLDNSGKFIKGYIEKTAANKVQSETNSKTKKNEKS